MLQTLRKQAGEWFTPAARAWMRYSPIAFGKPWLWQQVWWRRRAFACKTKFGMQVTGDTQDVIQRYLYYFGTWEPHITHWISSALQPGDGFIDAGANIGYYSLLASKRVGPHGKVVAIEAAPWIHAILDRHVALNRLHNIRTVQAAVAATRGVAHVSPGPDDNIGRTSTVGTKQTGDRCSEVKALPMHEILTADEVQRARIIKIDVEGAERDVLRGLVPVFGRLRRECEILMEISPCLMPEGAQGATEILATMQEHGFSAFRMENNYGAESYWGGGGAANPVPWTGTRIEAQEDILFRRT